MPSTSPRFSVSLFVGLMLAGVAAGSLIAFALLAGGTTELLPPRVRANQLTVEVPPVVLPTTSEPERTQRDRSGPQTVAVVSLPDAVLPASIARDDLPRTTDTAEPPRARDRSKPDKPRDRGPVARPNNDDDWDKPGKGPKKKEWKHKNGHYVGRGHAHVAKPAKPAAKGHPSGPSKPKPQGVAKGHDKSKGKGHKSHPHR